MVYMGYIKTCVMQSGYAFPMLPQLKVVNKSVSEGWSIKRVDSAMPLVHLAGVLNTVFCWILEPLG